MVTYTKEEMVASQELGKSLDEYLDKLVSNTLNKIAVIRNDKIEAIIIAIDEYERLCAICKAYDNEQIEKYYIDAMKIYEDALSHFPLNETIANNLIKIYRKLNKFHKLETLLLLLTDKFKDNIQYKMNLADFYLFANKFDKAANIYKSILTFKEVLPAYNNLAVCLKELGYYDDAVKIYLWLLEYSQSNVGVLNNLSVVYKLQGDFQASLKCLEQSIKIDNTNDTTFTNLGALYKTFFKYPEAMEAYKYALRLNPKNVNANYDFSLLLLYYGYYEQGFKHYEFRMNLKDLFTKVAIYDKKKLWRGENLRGKILLIQNEQGLGDNIMFSRYITLLASQNDGKIILRSRKELATLFHNSFPNVLVILENEEIPSYDYFVLIGSFPYIFKTSTNSIIQKFPYLLNNQIVDHSMIDAKINIALIYSSSQTNKDYKNKNFPPEIVFELFDIEGVKIYSLQMDSAKNKIAKYDKIIDMSPYITDMATTAAYLKHFNYVITCDTAVAHLCGALNIKAIVLLPKPNDWRWGSDQLLWYQSLRLFRQKNRGDWIEVGKRVVIAIKKECAL